MLVRFDVYRELHKYLQAPNRNNFPNPISVRVPISFSCWKLWLQGQSALWCWSQGNYGQVISEVRLFCDVGLASTWWILFGKQYFHTYCGNSGYQGMPRLYWVRSWTAHQNSYITSKKHIIYVLLQVHCIEKYKWSIKLLQIEPQHFFLFSI